MHSNYFVLINKLKDMRCIQQNCNSSDCCYSEKEDKL